jgi:hypothetical protein
LRLVQQLFTADEARQRPRQPVVMAHNYLAHADSISEAGETFIEKVPSEVYGHPGHGSTCQLASRS